MGYILRLQRTAGNNATGKLLRSGVLQAKLRIGPANDRYEHEADRIADRVVSMTGSTIGGEAEAAYSRPGNSAGRISRAPLVNSITQLQQNRKTENELQEKENTVSSSLETSLNSAKGNGRPLSGGERAYFEPRFGTGFAGVKIHTGSHAAQLSRSVNARAFTVGRDIFFGAGEYSPNTVQGKRLMAHELTHTVQQGASGAETINKVMLQRKGKGLSCDLGHLKAEYAAAPASCKSIQSKYCKKKYPTAKDIDQLHRNAIKGAKTYQSKYPNAAKNLLHFLSGSGSEMTMNYALFKNNDATKDKLKDEHREKFILGAKRRLKSGALSPAKSADMIWTGTANAFSVFDKTDLGLAVGGYTLCSKVTVSVADKGKGKHELSFDKWSVQAFDCYNWDPGKGVGVPGADDNDLCCLQNAGKGKYFMIKTAPWQNDYLPSRKKEVI